jgi:hypothetical protein
MLKPSRRILRLALSLTTTVLMLPFCVQSASAQAPGLTNEDVMRLVAMRVSDQTVTAVINEAKARRFNLSPLAVDDLAFHGVSTAVIAAMRQSSNPTPPAVGAVAPAEQAATPVRAQSLAEASAAAKQVQHEWALSTNVGGASTTAPPAVASKPEVTKSEGSNAVTVKDEGWWRKRMSGLREQLATDTAACQPIAAKIKALQSTYDGYVFVDRDGTAKINTAAAATIETKLVEAKSEQQKCLAQVALDKNAISTAEEEARRLGVLPGWLR